MTTHRALFIPFALALAACGPQSEEVRSVGAYDAAKVNADLDVELLSDETIAKQEVIVTCYRGELETLETRVDDDELTIEYTGDDAPEDALDGCAISLYASDGVDIEVVDDAGSTDVTVGDEGAFEVERLAGARVYVDLSGDAQGSIGVLEADEATLVADAQSQLSVGGVVADELSVDANGQTLLELSGLDVGSWSVTSRGGSQVLADGLAVMAELDAAGNALIGAIDVMADEVMVDARGTAEVRISADESAEVDARGRAEVAIGGDATDLDVSTSGAADVETGV